MRNSPGILSGRDFGGQTSQFEISTGLSLSVPASEKKIWQEELLTPFCVLGSPNASFLNFVSVAMTFAMTDDGCLVGMVMGVSGLRWGRLMRRDLHNQKQHSESASRNMIV